MPTHAKRAPQDETGLGPAPGPRPSVHELFEAHAEAIWRFLRRLGVADSAEDAVQDVFLAAHRRLGEFRGASTARTWLFGIALNVARDHRRAWRRRLRRLVAWPSRLEEPAEDVDVDAWGAERITPEQLVARGQAVARLAAILGRMKEEPRALFVLIELEGVSLTDAARLIGVPLSTAHSRLANARAVFDREITRLARAQTQEGDR